jgi:hypothetical protein
MRKRQYLNISKKIVEENLVIKKTAGTLNKGEVKAMGKLGNENGCGFASSDKVQLDAHASAFLAVGGSCPCHSMEGSLATKCSFILAAADDVSSTQTKRDLPSHV